MNTMSEAHTGASYVDAISARPSDRRARAAFQRLVLRIARPGDALFDFGCGPGIDARFYAERGFTVDAYDVDPRMCDYFVAHCRELIESGHIALHRGPYQDFLYRDAGDMRPAELVTSNFAPLNLIADLPPLFAKFHALTAPGGKVLASVLSPYFIGDCRYPWWWRNYPRLWREGHFAVPGAQGPVVRRRLADFAARAVPYFALRHVFSGASEHGYGPVAWLPLTTCRFMFLLFEKL